MLEISPVLAGTYDAPDYAPAKTNINTARAAQTAAAEAASPAENTVDAANDTDASPSSSTPDTSATIGVDPRRYTQFDRTAADSGTADFSFSDFLDTINPLQHIPVLSSVYRSITDEKINPVARVTGDILYGGLLGGVTGVISGVGAIGNSLIEAQTGQDMTGTVVSSLLGPGDSRGTTQLAANDQAGAVSQTSAAPATPSPATPSLATSSPTVPTQAIAGSGAQLASATAQTIPVIPSATGKSTFAASLTAAGSNDATTPAVAALTEAKAFPLDPKKLPYGGVLDTSKDIQAQNTAIALSESSHAMRLGHTVYTSRLMNGPHPMPIMAATATPPAPVNATVPQQPAIASNAASTPTNPTSSAMISSQPSGETAAALTASVHAPVAASEASNPVADINAKIVASNSSTAAAASSPASSTAQKNPLPPALIDDMLIMKALGQYRSLATGASGTTSSGSTLNITN